MAITEGYSVGLEWAHNAKVAGYRGRCAAVARGAIAAAVPLSPEGLSRQVYRCRPEGFESCPRYQFNYVRRSNLAASLFFGLCHFSQVYRKLYRVILMAFISPSLALYLYRRNGNQKHTDFLQSNF